MTTAIIFVLAIAAGIAAVQIRNARLRRQRRAEDELRRILAQLQVDFADLQEHMGNALLPSFKAMVAACAEFGEALQREVQAGLDRDPEEPT